MEFKNLYNNFRQSVMVCLVLLLVITGVLFYYGKHGSFIIINSSYHENLDLFFKLATLLGDGLIYVPVLLYCIFFNRAYLIPALTGIIVCTLLAQGLKHFVFADELRPFSIETEKVIIRKVEGVPIHRKYSFPSGHTSTAFTIALLLSAIMKRKIWVYLLPFLAMLVGYSRVYLAQHFLSDVLGGMIIGIISATCGLIVYWRYRKEKHIPEASDMDPGL